MIFTQLQTKDALASSASTSIISTLKVDKQRV